MAKNNKKKNKKHTIKITCEDKEMYEHLIIYLDRVGIYNFATCREHLGFKYLYSQKTKDNNFNLEYIKNKDF